MSDKRHHEDYEPIKLARFRKIITWLLYDIFWTYGHNAWGHDIYGNRAWCMDFNARSGLWKILAEVGQKLRRDCDKEQDQFEAEVLYKWGRLVPFRMDYRLALMDPKPFTKADKKALWAAIAKIEGSLVPDGEPEIAHRYTIFDGDPRTINLKADFMIERIAELKYGLEDKAKGNLAGLTGGLGVAIFDNYGGPEFWDFLTELMDRTRMGRIDFLVHWSPGANKIGEGLNSARIYAELAKDYFYRWKESKLNIYLSEPCVNRMHQWTWMLLTNREDAPRKCPKPVPTYSKGLEAAGFYSISGTKGQDILKLISYTGNQRDRMSWEPSDDEDMREIAQAFADNSFGEILE